VVSVGHASARRSVVAALPALREVWEVSYDPGAQDLPTGLIHDFRLREGAFVRGYLNPRRTRVEESPEQLRVDPSAPTVLSADRLSPAVHVLHLDVRRRIGTLPLAGVPLLARAASRDDGASRTWLVPLRGGGLALVDPAGVRLRAGAATRAEIATIATHERAARAWVAYAPPGPGDLLEPVGADGSIDGPGWRPVPDARVAALAYLADGERLAVAVDGDGGDGRIAVHDAATQREVWRLRVPRPAALLAVPRADGGPDPVRPR
jgi:hypothetical protein